MGLFDFIFGKSTPKYPFVTNDMLQPVGATLTSTEAKQIYREFMLKIGYHDGRTEAKWGVDGLADAIKQRTEVLEFDLDEAKRSAEDFSDDRESLKELKADLKKCKLDAERAEIVEEIADIERTLNREAETMAAAKAALAAFKKCKRAFLIDYINQELHGDSDQGRSGDA